MLQNMFKTIHVPVFQSADHAAAERSAGSQAVAGRFRTIPGYGFSSIHLL